MQFAHDTEEALEFAVVLGNTGPEASRSGADELGTLDQLVEFLARYPISGRIDADERERLDVLRARDQLRLVWSLDRDNAALQVNTMLAEAHALPYLARHDGSDWHMHATTSDAPLGERMRVEAALALMDVIRMDEMQRLRICEADDCAGLIIDLSRNGSKRYCSARCGSRMNMIAFRKRQGEQG
ncbi:MAG: CGNR zinc finger domain-containing protein [Cryobacterium sp.]